MPPERAARAVLDLVDLAIRHLTVEQRGETTLASHDERVLRRVVESLEAHRHAIAVPKVTRRTKLLTPEQAAIGYLRIDFDHLCRAAAGAKFTRDRDKTLEELLWRACQREAPQLEITREHVRAAVSAVRDEVLKKLEAEGADEDWLLPGPWDETTNKKQWQATAVAAGRLLRRVLEQATPRPPSCAESSTAEYAYRVKAAGPALAARSILPLHRLMYLATVLGASPDVAPQVASQLHESLRAARSSGSGTPISELFGRTEWANAVVPEGSNWAAPENPWDKKVRR